MASGEQIRQWNETLRSGKTVSVGGTDLDKAMVVAVVRNLHGRGPDATDPFGAEAMALVREALAA